MKNNIRVERAIKNITQADLADLIGVSRHGCGLRASVISLVTWMTITLS